MSMEQKKKYSNAPTSTHFSVGESVVAYQHAEPNLNASMVLTKEVLDAECISLDESRSLLIEKIRTHFHR